MLELSVLFLLREIVERLHVLEAHPANIDYKECGWGACHKLRCLETGKL